MQNPEPQKGVVVLGKKDLESWAQYMTKAPLFSTGSNYVYQKSGFFLDSAKVELQQYLVILIPKEFETGFSCSHQKSVSCVHQTKCK